MPQTSKNLGERSKSSLAAPRPASPKEVTFARVNGPRPTTYDLADEASAVLRRGPAQWPERTELVRLRALARAPRRGVPRGLGVALGGTGQAVRELAADGVPGRTRTASDLECSRQSPGGERDGTVQRDDGRCRITRTAYAALVTQSAVIRRGPNGRSGVVAKLGRLDVNGLPQVLGVTGVHSSGRCAPDWYHVQLAVVPNGTSGWVRAWAVRTYQVHSRIVVDLSERSLRLYRSGRVALGRRSRSGRPRHRRRADGTSSTSATSFPTQAAPSVRSALGISAHSDVLQDVWVEDGPIGIHGTNEPWSIGRAASHGCIRVANDVMRRLFKLAPAGTPIVVRA